MSMSRPLILGRVLCVGCQRITLPDDFTWKEDLQKPFFRTSSSFVATHTNTFPYLRIFHQSFSNFLNTPSRAKDLFVPLTRVHAHKVKCSFQHIYHPILRPRSSYVITSSAIRSLRY